VKRAHAIVLFALAAAAVVLNMAAAAVAVTAAAAADNMLHLPIATAVAVVAHLIPVQTRIIRPVSKVEMAK